MVQQAPRFPVEDAVRLASEYYGLAATASPLPSERDQNFLLRDSAARQFVLKIANPEEALEVLTLQNKVMQFLAASHTGLEWPRVVPTLSGNEIVPVASGSGEAYTASLPTRIGAPPPSARMSVRSRWAAYPGSVVRFWKSRVVLLNMRAV